VVGAADEIMAVKHIAVKKRPWLLLPDWAKKSRIADGDRNARTTPRRISCHNEFGGWLVAADRN
jgi:hypothetical protein